MWESIRASEIDIDNLTAKDPVATLEATIKADISNQISKLTSEIQAQRETDFTTVLKDVIATENNL